jgi:hypothetical protein
MYHEPTFPSRRGALYLHEILAYATVLLTSLPADMNIIILSPPLPPQKSSSSFLLYHHAHHHHHFHHNPD